MSLAVKCTRVLPNACRYIPRYTSTVELSPAVANFQSQEKFRSSGYPSWGIAGLGVLGTMCVTGYAAMAKEAYNEDEDDDFEEDEDDDFDEDEDAMSALIGESAAELVDVPTNGQERFELWNSVQEKYLLLSEMKRANIELRDVTDEELAKSDSLYEKGCLTDCEDLLVELNTVSPHNDRVLWRLARLKWVIGRAYSTYHGHKVFHVAHSLACQAAEINPENGDAHRWIAILSFYRAEKEGIKAGVRNLEGMKYHLDRALEINPNDNVALTLLGNWHFECADMSRLTRLWCRVFAGVAAPQGSYKKALQLFEKSHSIESWIHNSYWIAKTHLRLRQREEALNIFNELAGTTITTSEDFRIRKEAHIHIKRMTHPPPVTKMLSYIIDGYLENWRIPFVLKDNISTYNEDTNWNMMRGKYGPHDPTF